MLYFGGLSKIRTPSLPIYFLVILLKVCLQVLFEDGQRDEMVWCQLIASLREPPKALVAAREARRAKNERRRARAKEEETSHAILKAKHARHDLKVRKRLEMARAAPEDNQELLDKVREKKRAKRARKKEERRLADALDSV
jgi:hypothetical protein